MRKSYIQFVLLIVCVVSVYVVYKQFFNNKTYFQEDVQVIRNKDKVIINENSQNNKFPSSEKNFITNLKYKSFDAMGNEYLINSKSAEISPKNEELIKLIDVSAKIILKNKPPILITSDYAIHNKNDFDTKFYENVYISHEDIKIYSENLDLMYNSNFVSLYNIKDIYNNKMKLKADKIDFDIVTKNLSINMYKNNRRVQINYK